MNIGLILFISSILLGNVDKEYPEDLQQSDNTSNSEQNSKIIVSDESLSSDDSSKALKTKNLKPMISGKASTEVKQENHSIFLGTKSVRHHDQY